PPFPLRIVGVNVQRRYLERSWAGERLRTLQGEVAQKRGPIPQAHVVHRGVPRDVKRDRAGCLNDAVARGAPRDALPRVPATAHLVGASRPRVTGVQRSEERRVGTVNNNGYGLSF